MIQAAEIWFEENDPEGVAFEYEVLECASARNGSASRVVRCRRDAYSAELLRTCPFGML